MWSIYDFEKIPPNAATSFCIGSGAASDAIVVQTEEQVELCHAAFARRPVIKSIEPLAEPQERPGGVPLGRPSGFLQTSARVHRVGAVTPGGEVLDGRRTDFTIDDDHRVAGAAMKEACANCQPQDTASPATCRAWRSHGGRSCVGQHGRFRGYAQRPA